MYIVSSRENFSDPDRLSSGKHQAKEIDLSDDSEIQSFLDISDFISAISGQRILMLVHGYNNEQDEVYDAYSVIEKMVATHLNEQYDHIVGYSWPGGDQGLEWWASKKRANSVARKFRFLLEAMSSSASFIDIMSHSLGARVVLKALKQSNSDMLLRNYYCTAPAVDNEVFEEEEEFSASINKSEAIYVFHSKKDRVLSFAYRLAEFDRALGLSGPEDKAYIQYKTSNIYVANCKRIIDSHGAYKRSAPMYKYISSCLRKKPIKFKTLYG